MIVTFNIISLVIAIIIIVTCYLNRHIKDLVSRALSQPDKWYCIVLDTMRGHPDDIWKPIKCVAWRETRN